MDTGEGIDGGRRRQLGHVAGGSQRRCAREELGDALLHLARRVDDLLFMDGLPLRDEVRELRLRITAALHALGSVENEVNATRDDAGLGEHLRAIASEYAEATGTSLDVRLRGPVAGLPPPSADTLSRVVAEALWNVDRHSRAAVMVLSLVVDERGAVLDLVDDGVDISTRQVPLWGSSVDLGVQRMRRLVAEAGGRLALKPLQPRGLRLRVVIPTEARAVR